MSPRHVSRRPGPGAALLAALIAAGCNGPTDPGTPPSITTTELPDGEIGEVYTASITATGGDGEFSWSQLDGTIPPGLALSVDDLSGTEALITGTPQTAGTFTFRVRVEDGNGLADTAQLSIAVASPPQPVQITTPRIPPGLVGSPYLVTLQATGGEQTPGGNDADDFEWAVVEGSLPPGLELGSDGQFSGTAQSTGTATFTVEATSGGFASQRSFTLEVVADNPGRFDITPFAVVPIPPGLDDNVREAVRRWEAAIVGDLEGGNVPEGFFGPDGCGGFGELVNGAPLDDILIMINIASIDGPGGVLAQAGPCAIRGDTTPVVGILILDRDDLQALTNEETITDIIQHEMAHVLGFGSLWQNFGLLLGEGTSTPLFVGDQAVAEYQTATGANDSIPVEADGGPGTRDAHWDEEVFGDELMTGFIEPQGTDMPLSRMTIASFADMGYQVDLSAADPAALMAAMADRPRRGAHLGYDILGDWPILVLHEDGTRSYLNRPPAGRP